MFLFQMVKLVVFKILRPVFPAFVICLTLGSLLCYFGIVRIQVVHLRPVNIHGHDSLGELEKQLHLANLTEESDEKGSTLQQVTNSTLKPATKQDTKKKKKKKKFKKINLTKDILVKSSQEVERELLVEYDLLKLYEAKNCTDWNVTTMPPYTRICKQNDIDSDVIITLFTTMHDSSKAHYIYENTLRLWEQLGHRVRKILFVASPAAEAGLVRDACANNWDVMTAPLCDPNKLPVLKAMFLAAQQVQDSWFYGYANGDILFDESLLPTLTLVHSMRQHFPANLLVGRRTNVQLEKNQRIEKLSEIRPLAAKLGSDGWVAAVDFFITRGRFPWPDVPKVVVGRIAYDNWMVRFAKERRMGVIDISNSTLSIHQVGQTGYYSSHGKKDSQLNIYVTGGFDFTQGLITCAELKTRVVRGLVKLHRRLKYGMCGAGHWSHRHMDYYGKEVDAEFNPEEWKLYAANIKRKKVKQKLAPH